ncbi:MAG: hypothetical protein QOF18_1996 [Frankiaceae bacterium]|nr:hypothetical protein [Frankiaceae bacterium]
MPAGPERSDVHAVGARCAAVAARVVLGQVDKHVVTVVRLANEQSTELPLPDDVDEGHRRLDRHPVDEWRVRRGGVQVVVEAAMPDQLGECMCVAQHAVDLLNDAVLVERPQPSQPRPQRLDLLELVPVVPPRAGPSPLTQKLIERGDVAEVVRVRPFGVDERCRGLERNLCVMSKEHLTPFMVRPSL